MDLDRLFRLVVTIAVLFWVAAILILVGEVRGWWNDAGEVGLTIVSGGGLLFTLAGLFLGATRGQARLVFATVVDNAKGVDRANSMLERIDEGVRDANGKLDLANIKLDQLDAIQFELDRQTGVMDRQLGVLVAIRDRL